MGFFSAENKIVQLLDIFFDYMLLLFLSLLFSVPIITIGPASTAKYYTAMKIARGESPNVIRAFLKSFRENFRQGLLLEGVAGIGILILGVDWYIILHTNFGLVSYVLLSVIAVATLIALFIGTYFFALLARFCAGTFRIVKCAFLIGIGKFWVGILLAVCNLAVPILCLVWSLYAPFIWLIAGSLLLSAKSHLLVMVLRQFENKE